MLAAIGNNDEASFQAFSDGLRDAWKRHDYQAIAEAGAKLGKFFMSDQIGKVPNEELGFAPEFFVFDKDGNFGVVAAPQLDAKAFGKILQDLFDAKPVPEGVKVLKNKPEGILVINAGYFSKTCHANLASIDDPDAKQKEFEEHPDSSYPDKITSSVGRVYLAPDLIVTAAAVAVGSEAELAAAGFEKASKAA